MTASGWPRSARCESGFARSALNIREWLRFGGASAPARALGEEGVPQPAGASEAWRGMLSSAAVLPLDARHQPLFRVVVGDGCRPLGLLATTAWSFRDTAAPRAALCALLCEHLEKEGTKRHSKIVNSAACLRLWLCVDGQWPPLSTQDP